MSNKRLPPNVREQQEEVERLKGVLTRWQQVAEHNEQVANHLEGNRDLIQKDIDQEWQAVRETVTRAQITAQVLNLEAGTSSPEGVSRKAKGDNATPLSRPKAPLSTTPLYLALSRLRFAVAISLRERGTHAARRAVQPRRHWFARCQRRLRTITARRTGDVDGSFLLERSFQGWRAIARTRLSERRLHRVCALRGVDPDLPGPTTKEKEAMEDQWTTAMDNGDFDEATRLQEIIDELGDKIDGSCLLMAWRTFQLAFRIARRARAAQALAFLRGAARTEWSQVLDGDVDAENECCCPISMTLLQDPVCVSDNPTLSLKLEGGGLEAAVCERRELQTWLLRLSRRDLRRDLQAEGLTAEQLRNVEQARARLLIGAVAALPQHAATVRRIALRYRKGWMVTVLRLWRVQAQRQARRRATLQEQEQERTASEAWLPSIWRRLQFAVAISRRSRHSRWAQQAAPAVGAHLKRGCWLRVLLDQWRRVTLRHKQRRRATGSIAAASIERHALLACAIRATCDLAVLKKERRKEFQKAKQDADFVQHQASLKEIKDRLRGEEIKVQQPARSAPPPLPSRVTPQECTLTHHAHVHVHVPCACTPSTCTCTCTCHMHMHMFRHAAHLPSALVSR